MFTVIVAQHFFSSVPAEKSPSRRRGYQTLFRTHGLTDEVVRAIEDRAQYTTATDDPVKRQFYPLPSGLIAISQSVALAELDEFGRKGRYLTHTLVLNSQTLLQQLGGCPLDVFTQFHFATSLSEAFQQGQMANGEAPSTRLNIVPEWRTNAVRAAQRWLPDSLTRLGRLTWNARQLAEKREVVALIGSEADQLEALAVLFLLSCPQERYRLSFDTHAAGCDWGRGVTFWAQGYTDQPGIRTAHIVDTHARSVTLSLSPSTDGLFAAWMVKEVLPFRLDDIQQKQIWAGYLEAVLTDSATTSNLPRKPEMIVAGAIPRDFIDRFARLNTSAVVNGWAAHLPPGLSAEFVQWLATDVTNEPESYLDVLLEGLQPQRIQEFMFNALLLMGDSPAKADRQVLEKWIKTCTHPGLLTLPPMWAKDGKAWFKSLTFLGSEDYEWIMKQLIRWRQPPIPLWEALVERHAIAWMWLVAPVMPPGDWKKALSVLQKMGDPIVDQLARVTPQLGEAARAEIINWLKGYKGMAPTLKAALGISEKGSKSRFRLLR